MKAYERLLKYVVVRTPSDENSETVPSSQCQFDLAKILKEEMKIAFILICHDLNAVRQVASRVIVMYLGRIMEEAEVKDIFENPRHPYTRALLASAPSADFKKRWKKPLPLDKDISSIWEETHGCPFYSRCPDRMAHCKNHIPQMRKTDSSHSYACFI